MYDFGVATRKDIRRELDRLAKLVEKAWKLHEKAPNYGKQPFVCPAVGVVGRCTDTAVYLADRLGGAVYGYTIEDNPDAQLGKDEFGHDFAVVDDRWLVDFWAKDTYQLPDLYDLTDPKDRIEVRRQYGDASKWERMSPENIAYNRVTLGNIT